MAKSKRVVQATNKKNKANAQKRAKVVLQNHKVLKDLRDES